MSNKKKVIDLVNQDIRFEVDNIHYRILKFYPSVMTLDILRFEKDQTKGELLNIPFAHLPKKIKKMIKPN